MRRRFKRGKKEILQLRIRKEIWYLIGRTYYSGHSGRIQQCIQTKVKYTNIFLTKFKIKAQ